MGRQLVILRSLTQSIERSAGEELRATHHPLEMMQRYGLRLWDAVHVDIGREAVVHALTLQRALDFRIGRG